MATEAVPVVRVRLRRAVFVAGAAIGLAGGYSPAYFGTLSVFLKPIASGFGWTRAQASLVAVLAQIGIALGAPIIGGLIDRYGGCRIIAPAVVLFALGLTGLTLVPNDLVLFGALTLLTGFVAVATTPVGYLSVLSRGFDRRLGLALGFAMLGLGIGTVLAPVIAQRWITAAGWHSAYRSVALLVLALGAVALVLMVAAGGAQATSGRTRPAEGAPPLPGMLFAEGLRSGRFWLIALVFFAVSAAALGAAVHMVAMLSDRGMPPALAARGAAWIGIGLMVGRFGAGALMDMVHARYVAALAFSLGAAGLALLAWLPAPSLAVTSTGAVLFGLTVGAEGDIMPFLVRRYFGLLQFSLFFGVFLGIYSLGGVVGPVLYGAVFDRLHGYGAALGSGAAICAGAALAILALGPYRFAAAAAARRG